MGSCSPNALAGHDPTYVSPPPASGHVLVIGDHGGDRDRLGQLLIQQGFRVASMQTPSARLYETVALTRGVDVVVVDLGRELDPWLLIRRIRSVNRRAKVILCSDSVSAARLACGLYAGALAVLMKPFDAAQMAGLIRMAMETTARNDD